MTSRELYETHMMHLSLDDLNVVKNPRNKGKRLKSTKSLQTSILEVGLKTPLAVYEETLYRKGEPHIGWLVENGARRVTALRALRDKDKTVPGLDYNAIPCFISNRGEDREETDVLLDKVAANNQEPLSPSDIGLALARAMMDKRWPQSKAARAIGIPATWVPVYIALANADKKVQVKVDSGEMSLSAFKAIMSSRAAQEKAAEKDGKVTVKAAKKMSSEARTVGVVALEGTVPDEPTIVYRLNKIKSELEEIFYMPALGPGEIFVLDQIGEMMEDRAKMLGYPVR